MLHKIKRTDGATICEIEAETVAEAVSEAVRRGIDLSYASLVGARLNHANLNCANLNCASLNHANLNHASLNRASLNHASLTMEHKAEALVARATRVIEPYEFFLWATDNGPLIRAGCRTMTPAEYRARITGDSYDAAKRAETARILDYFDAAWAAYEKDNAQ